MDVTYPKNLDAFCASRPTSFEDALKLIKQYGNLLYLFERLGQSDMVKAVEDVLYHLRYCYYIYKEDNDIEGRYFIVAYERQFPTLKLTKDTIPTSDLVCSHDQVEAPVSQVPEHDRQVVESAPPTSVSVPPTSVDCDPECCVVVDESPTCKEPCGLVVECTSPPESWIPTFDVVLQVRRSVSKICSYVNERCSEESFHQTPEFATATQSITEDVLCVASVSEPVPTALCVKDDTLVCSTGSDVNCACTYKQFIHLQNYYEEQCRQIDWSVWGELPYIDPFIEHELQSMKRVLVPDDLDVRVLVLLQACVRGKVFRGRDFLLCERTQTLKIGDESLRRRCLPALAYDLVQLAGGLISAPRVS